MLVKYSPSKEVVIKTEEQNIIFENSGDKLGRTSFRKTILNHFSQMKINQKDSFGLGLYIIHNILKANGLYFRV
jgi:two-component system, OmpR family, sensor kinase